MKAGQVLANRPDVVRADFMEELTKLQDDVPAFKSERLLGHLGRVNLENRERCVRRDYAGAIAAASLGQV